MGNELIWLLGLGAVTVAGMFVYAYSKDEKDPFGYLSETFARFDLGDVFSGTFLDKNYNPEIPKGTTIHPKTGESMLQMFGK